MTVRGPVGEKKMNAHDRGREGARNSENRTWFPVQSSFLREVSLKPLRYAGYNLTSARKYISDLDHFDCEVLHMAGIVKTSFFEKSSATRSTLI